MTRRNGLAGLVCFLTATVPCVAANKKHLPEVPVPDTYIIDTSLGAITIELDAVKAPLHAANFGQYVDGRFYDGLIFHRVMPTFMIQGGGFDAEMKQKATRASIALESRNGLSNMRGTVAMARTTVPDSATSQFFINVVDNQRLDAANSPDGNG